MQAFGAFDSFERDLLTSFQGFVSFHADSGVMSEKVIASVIWKNEPETFGIIEPLHVTCAHGRTSGILLIICNYYVQQRNLYSINWHLSKDGLPYAAIEK
jgi:hypothetical protein